MHPLSNLGQPDLSSKLNLKTMIVCIAALFLLACGDGGGTAGTNDTTGTEDLGVESLDSASVLTPDAGSLDAAPENVLPELANCTPVPLMERAADPGERGPWAVGAKTVKLGRLTIELLYPAVPGSEEGLDPMEVDIRYALPESERKKVTDDVRPHQSCDCYVGLPVDLEHGPYPLVLFVHGTASWRTQSLSLMEHWASRGFVVASADHPGLWLSDILGSVCGLPPSGNQDLLGDLEVILGGFSGRVEGFNFLAGSVNLERIAVIGHSAGGGAATAAAELDGAQVVISMAGASPTQASDLSSALFLGGMSDTVVSFSQTQSAYNASTAPRRLVGISEGAHLIFSDICELTNDKGQDLVEIATEAGVCGTQFASFLFDCAASTIPVEDSRTIIKAATTWELERHLHCNALLRDFEDFGAQSSWIEVLESADAE